MIRIKRKVCFIFIFTIVISLFSVYPVNSSTLKNGKIKLYKNDVSYFKFYLKEPSIVYFNFDFKFKNKTNKKEYIYSYICQYDDDFNEKYSHEYKMKIPKNTRDYSYWYYIYKHLPAGEFELSLDSNIAGSCNYKIRTYNGFAQKINVPKKIKIKTGRWKKFEIKNLSGSNMLNGAEWKSSNKKIAKTYYDGKSKYVYCYGKKSGRCKITAKLRNGKRYSVKVSVKDPKYPELVYKNVYLYRGQKERFLRFTKNKKIHYYSSNYNVAKLTKKGNIKAVGVGKCKIYAKYKKKKYKCNVSVMRRNPNFTGLLYDYYTRDNYFEVRFKNHSNRALTIHSNGAYCMDADYKSYDRNLHLPKYRDITIQKKSKKTVRFYVIGSTTWPNYKSFTIRYYFTFDGYKYLGSLWDEDSVYKKKSGWYNTYWNEDILSKDLY